MEIKITKEDMLHTLQQVIKVPRWGGHGELRQQLHELDPSDFVIDDFLDIEVFVGEQRYWITTEVALQRFSPKSTNWAVVIDFDVREGSKYSKPVFSFRDNVHLQQESTCSYCGAKEALEGKDWCWGCTPPDYHEEN